MKRFGILKTRTDRGRKAQCVKNYNKHKTKTRVTRFWFLKTKKHLSKITITFDPVTWGIGSLTLKRRERRTDGGGPGVVGGFLLLRGGVAGLFRYQEGGILLGSLTPLTTRTYVHSKQVTQEQTKYNKVVHNSNFSILPFPPEPVVPLEELL